MGLVKRLWGGQVPLVRTYWVFGFAVNVFINVVIMLLATVIVEVPALAWPLVGVSLFSIVYMVFISVAIWRSSNRYEGYKGWAYLAKAMVVLGVVKLILDFAKNVA